jgi:hypothetical protein
MMAVGGPDRALAHGEGVALVFRGHMLEALTATYRSRPTWDRIFRTPIRLSVTLSTGQRVRSRTPWRWWRTLNAQLQRRARQAEAAGREDAA